MFTTTDVLRSPGKKQDPCSLKGELHLVLRPRTTQKETVNANQLIKLLLHDKNLPEDRCEIFLLEALHAVRSMICLLTNETPHERLFQFSRRAITVKSLPSWLLSPGPALLRRFVRRKEVELVEANPSYAVVRFSDEREISISASDLAPLPESPVGLVDTLPRGVF